jgi:predicted ester cyclase
MALQTPMLVAKSLRKQIHEAAPMQARSLLTGPAALLVLLAACSSGVNEAQLEANKQVLRRLLDGMDSGNWAVLDSVLSPDLVVHFPGDRLDRQETEATTRMFYTAFPDLSHTIEDLLAIDDKVVLRATDRGTHRGDFQGIAPTGKAVACEVIAIYRLADGKIVEIWEQGDFLGLRQQLGAESRPQ